MGIIGSVLETLGITKSGALTPAEREQRALALLRDVEARHASTRERTATRASELAEFAGVLESAEGELREASEAYDRTPTDPAGRKVLRAREVRDLAALRVDAAQRRHGQALAEEQAAAELVAKARAALEAARADVELARILESASLETFRVRVAPHVAEALAAEERLRSAMAEIDRAYFESNDAADKARELGAELPDLDHTHAVASVLLAMCEGDPPMLRQFLSRFNDTRLFVWPNLETRAVFGPMRPAELRAFVSQGPRTPPGEEDRDRAALGALLSGRTYREGLAALARFETSGAPDTQPLAGSVG